MAGRRADVLDIREILRRLQLGERDRRIARDLRISRKTVGKYREWAAAQALLTGPLPDTAALQAAWAATLPVVRPPTTPSSVERFRQRIVDLRKHGVECRAIHQILREEGGFAGDADVPQAIGPIARDLQVDEHVVAQSFSLFQVEPRHHETLDQLAL